MTSRTHNAALRPGTPIGSGGTSRIGTLEWTFPPERPAVSPSNHRTLVLRFGSIGDFVSAMSFCNARDGYDLFFAGSVGDFVLGHARDLCKLLPFATANATTRVHLGSLAHFFKLLQEGHHSRILVFPQSQRAPRLKAIVLLLHLLNIFAFRRRLDVKYFFFGGQYVHLLNKDSQIKSIIKSLPSAARISIFYDSKEPANNLSVATIAMIDIVLRRALGNPVISLYGSTRLELDGGCMIRNLTGQTSLEEIQPVFQETDLAITCDSGPLHVFSERGIPCIAFMSARQEVMNWVPLTIKNYYIFDDGIECLGCRKAVCPRGENLCVNSEITREAFNGLFK